MDSNFLDYPVHSTFKIAANASVALKKPKPTFAFAVFDHSYKSGFSLCSEEIMRTE